MAVNKVTLNGNTLIDLTSDSVTPETLAVGATAHDSSGNIISGRATPIGNEPLFELIGKWSWQEIDLKTNKAGSTGWTVEHSNGWTVQQSGQHSHYRTATYKFPKKYKKVIAMVSWDPNYDPTNPEYGQTFTGDIASTFIFQGDCGGVAKVTASSSHNNSKNIYTRVFCGKENGLWNLNRTANTSVTGNAVNVYHYQSGYYGSYDIQVPALQGTGYNADSLGTYERIESFTYQTYLPYYNGSTQENLRGMLCLYGIPEGDPEDLYDIKFYNINIESTLDSWAKQNGINIVTHTKQYSGGNVSMEFYGTLDEHQVEYVLPRDASDNNIPVRYHSYQSDTYGNMSSITFTMPSSNVYVTCTYGDIK